MKYFSKRKLLHHSLLPQCHVGSSISGYACLLLLVLRLKFHSQNKIFLDHVPKFALTPVVSGIYIPHHQAFMDSCYISSHHSFYRTKNVHLFFSCKTGLSYPLMTHANLFFFSWISCHYNYTDNWGSLVGFFFLLDMPVSSKTSSVGVFCLFFIES